MQVVPPVCGGVAGGESVFIGLIDILLGLFTCAVRFLRGGGHVGLPGWWDMTGVSKEYSVFRLRSVV
jgi:hypothetical protein